MRRLAMAVAMACLAHQAEAGSLLDLPVLRGALPVTGLTRATTNWEGYYVGGDASYGSSGMNFANATKDLVAFMLSGTTIENEYGVSDWNVLGKTTRTASGFGGFVGYNMQWGEAVIGTELNYNHATFDGSASDVMSRIFTTSDGYSNTVTTTAAASVKLKDFGTARLRLGWANGDLLAYGLIGVAIGRADVSRSATVTASGTYVGATTPPPADYGPTTTSQSITQSNKILYGYAFGLGADYALAGNVFLRGEWEYVALTGPVATNINTVRGGLGVKF